MKKIIFFLTLLSTLGFATNSDAVTVKHAKAKKVVHHVVKHKVVHHVTSVKSTSYNAPSCSSGMASVSTASDATSTGFMTTPGMSTGSLILSSPYAINTPIDLGTLPDATWTGSGPHADFADQQSANTYYHNFHTGQTTVNGFTVVEQNNSHSQIGKGLDQTAGSGVSPRASETPTSFGPDDFGSMRESR